MSECSAGSTRQRPALNSRRVAAAVALLGGLGALGAATPAAEARAAAPCGATLSAPGTYVLAADCNGAGITIASSNVTLKLDGHTITAGAPSSGDGILVDDGAGPLSGVTVQGPGTISGYGTGIDIGVWNGFGVSGSTFAGVEVDDAGDGIWLESGASDDTVNRATTQDDFYGIVLDTGSSDNTIIHNTGGAGGAIGIMLLPGTSGNTVNNNDLTSRSATGIAVLSGATRNTINNNIVATATGGFSLFDENTDCGTDVWRNNSFDVDIASPSICIG